VAAVRRATKAQWSEISVSTAAGLRVVEIAMDSDVAGSGTALMGMVTLVPGPEGSLGAADVGNPHVVVRDDSSWSTSDREERARHFQALMPDGANVEFVSVVHPARVSMKVYERGVGWTQACGTGSVAVAAVLHERGETGPRIIVENPGGELTVSLDGNQATLGGPVAFDGEWEWSI
jgi:diaminopimelate epimerase